MRKAASGSWLAAWLGAALLGLGASGCEKPCALSADVQLTLHGDDSVLAQATRLVVGIAIESSPRIAYQLPFEGTLRDGRSVLLSPNAPLPGDAYALTLDVSALRADDTVAAIGTVSKGVGTKACNRLDLSLSSLPSPDMATGPEGDMASFASDLDMSTVPDLQACVAATPDEDGDGSGDVCDVCAADSNPTIVDTDSDGVPDVCDPDVAVPTNKRVYFEPFNAKGASWDGIFTVSGGVAEVSVMGSGLGTTSVGFASDKVTALPGDVSLEAHAVVTAIPDSFDGGVAVMLWTSVNKSGYRCVVEKHSIGDPAIVLSGPNLIATQAALPATAFGVGKNLIVRIWKHGATVGCALYAQVKTNLVQELTSTLSVASNVPLYPGIGGLVESYSNAGTVTTQFSSLFAVSYP